MIQNLDIQAPDKTSGDPAPPAPFPKAWQVWGVVFLTLAVLLFASVAAFDVFGAFAIVIVETAMIVPALLYLSVTGFSIRTVCRIKPVSGRVGLLSVIVGATLPIVASALDSALGDIYPMPDSLRETMEQLLRADSASELTLIFAGLVLAAAVCEELFFRGFLQTSLEWWYGPIWGIGLASVAFSAIHINPWWFVSILFAGVICGILAYTTGSVFPGMIVHGMNNGLFLLVANAETYPALGRVAMLETVSVSTAVVSAGVMAAALVWLVRMKDEEEGICEYKEYANKR